MLIHAFNPEEPLSCNNLSLMELIGSPTFYSQIDAGIADAHCPVEALSLEAIANCDFRSVITPRAIMFMKGFMLARGMRVTDGYGSQLGFSEAQQNHWIGVYRNELRFEELRRNHAPQCPSRLGCIWAAEDSVEGRAVLDGMFGSDHRRIIVRIEIHHALNVFRADASCFDRFCTTQDDDFARMYWQGETLTSQWEYLIDGAIRVIDPEALNLLLNRCREYGNPTLGHMNPPSQVG
ncbi:DUF2441 domain-containing protein [Pseudomonas fulva]|uniref:DUF2441 domain-containing protein n=1 Tax=Pseudomonas fulva TaxID=47880 RepID=UPI00201E5D10|nr:DUF2441 domain-containing protein [Pseudomonas fulva]UQY32907.1 DUF2441 domain-containing protein [Pseudomonas fulva]